jgi:hypothetical protein
MDEYIVMKQRIKISLTTLIEWGAAALELSTVNFRYFLLCPLVSFIMFQPLPVDFRAYSVKVTLYDRRQTN